MGQIVAPLTRCAGAHGPCVWSKFPESDPTRLAIRAPSQASFAVLILVKTPAIDSALPDSREATKNAKAKERVVRHPEELARIAVDLGFKLHRDLGPGLLESVYEALLAAQLAGEGLVVERQKPIPIDYGGLTISEGFRADIVLEGSLIIEIKSVERFAPVHGKQLLTYLKLTGQPLGLLMNFGAATFQEGVKRIVNGHTDFASSRLRVHQTI